MKNKRKDERPAVRHLPVVAAAATASSLDDTDDRGWLQTQVKRRPTVYERARDVPPPDVTLEALRIEQQQRDEQAELDQRQNEYRAQQELIAMQGRFSFDQWMQLQGEMDAARADGTLDIRWFVTAPADLLPRMLPPMSHLEKMQRLEDEQMMAELEEVMFELELEAKAKKEEQELKQRVIALRDQGSDNNPLHLSQAQEEKRQQQEKKRSLPKTYKFAPVTPDDSPERLASMFGKITVNPADEEDWEQLLLQMEKEGLASQFASSQQQIQLDKKHFMQNLAEEELEAERRKKEWW